MSHETTTVTHHIGICQSFESRHHGLRLASFQSATRATDNSSFAPFPGEESDNLGKRVMSRGLSIGWVLGVKLLVDEMTWV